MFLISSASAPSRRLIFISAHTRSVLYTLFTNGTHVLANKMALSNRVQKNIKKQRRHRRKPPHLEITRTVAPLYGKLDVARRQLKCEKLIKNVIINIGIRIWNPFYLFISKLIMFFNPFAMAVVYYNAILSETRLKYAISYVVLLLTLVASRCLDEYIVFDLIIKIIKVICFREAARHFFFCYIVQYCRTRLPANII